MTFRPDYLKLNYFNSSKGNIKISEIEYFLNNIKYNPDNIIIVLDPYHFNQNFPEISKNNNFIIDNLKKNLYSSNIKFYYFMQKNIYIFSKFNQAIKDLKKIFLKYLKLKKIIKK